MQRKLVGIEVRIQTEESEKIRLKNMTKQQKDKYKCKMNGKVDPNWPKRKKKSWMQEKLDIHQAYQLLLSECHKREKQRAKQKKPP